MNRAKQIVAVLLALVIPAIIVASLVMAISRGHLAYRDYHDPGCAQIASC